MRKLSERGWIVSVVSFDMALPCACVTKAVFSSPFIFSKNTQPVELQLRPAVVFETVLCIILNINFGLFYGSECHLRYFKVAVEHLASSSRDVVGK